MKTIFLVLSLSLCLFLSSLHEGSCQDDVSGLSNLDLIERDYQDSVNALQGKKDEDQSAKIQSENQKNNTVTDKNTISLSLSDESKVGPVSDESVKRSSLLDQIELDFEAHLNSLNQAGSDGVKAESNKDDEILSAQRQKMLEEIEREFEAASTSLKQLKNDEINKGSDEEQAAKRHSLLEEIEREFEAATKELEQLKVNDFTGDKNDEEQSAKRKSMLEAIEREFEAAMEGIEELKISGSTGSGDDEEQSRRLSVLEEIELEFEAATKGFEQLKFSDSTKDNSENEQAANRQTMLDESNESSKLLQITLSNFMLMILLKTKNNLQRGKVCWKRLNVNLKLQQKILNIYMISLKAMLMMNILLRETKCWKRSNANLKLPQKVLNN